MNVLDIDLDFFLETWPRRERNGRLPSHEFRPWTPGRVEDYVVRRCGLRRCDPLQGAVVTYHHELFDLWKSLIESGRLSVPFNITHIDSHADLGKGDASHAYIMCELLHNEPSARSNPRRGGHDGLLEGNFLSFALACRWIASIEYIYHPDMPKWNGGLHDIPEHMFRDNDPRSGGLQLKRLPPECLNRLGFREEFEPLSLEPEIPIRLIDCREFHAERSFDFLFVAQSPNYTPATADNLLSVFHRFIRPIA